jgi:hypothetical protein
VIARSTSRPTRSGSDSCSTLSTCRQSPCSK